jgi:hypothetical protein
MIPWRAIPQTIRDAMIMLMSAVFDTATRAIAAKIFVLPRRRP